MRSCLVNRSICYTHQDINDNITFNRAHPNYLAAVKVEVKSLLDQKMSSRKDAQARNTALKAANDFISKGEPNPNQLSQYTKELHDYHEAVKQEQVDLTVAVARFPKGSSELQTRLNELAKVHARNVGKMEACLAFVRNMRRAEASREAAAQASKAAGPSK